MFFKMAFSVLLCLYFVFTYMFIKFHFLKLAGDNDDYDEENDELDLRKIKVSELQNLTDFLFKENGFTSTKDTWKRYLNLLFEDVEGVTLDLDGEDYLHFLPNDLEYITTIVLYLSKMPGVFIELYSWYQTIYSMILSTTSEIADYIYKESAPFRKYTVLRSRYNFIFFF